MSACALRRSSCASSASTARRLGTPGEFIGHRQCAQPQCAAPLVHRQPRQHRQQHRREHDHRGTQIAGSQLLCQRLLVGLVLARQQLVFLLPSPRYRIPPSALQSADRADCAAAASRCSAPACGTRRRRASRPGRRPPPPVHRRSTCSSPSESACRNTASAWPSMAALSFRRAS